MKARDSEVFLNSPLSSLVDALDSHDHQKLSLVLEASTLSPTDLTDLAAIGCKRVQTQQMDDWERCQIVKCFAESTLDPISMLPSERNTIHEWLRTGLRDDDWVVRGWAAEALAIFGSEEDIGVLQEVALADDHPWVQSDAIDTLYGLSPEALEPIVGELFERQDADPYVRSVAAVYVSAYGRSVVLPPAQSLLAEDEELLIRLLWTLRCLLGAARETDTLARTMLTSLAGTDLTPIVREEYELLTQLM